MYEHGQTVDRGRGIATDGGVAAANAPAANTDPASNLQGAGGFQQFSAQARLANAEEGSRMAANAAQETAQLRANAQLEKDEWKTLDQRLVEIAQEELRVVNELRARGLTVSEDLSTLIREWQKTNDFGDADVDMGAETGSSEDGSTFSLEGVPLPIVHKSFKVNYRRLLASRNSGQGLDTQNQSKAARSVMEGLDALALNGWSGNVEGYEVHGLTNHPDRNTVTGSNWGDYENNSADTVRGDFLDAIEANEDANYGPGNSGYLMFAGRGAYQALRRWDTGTDQERGLLERLRNEFDEELDSIVNAPSMADDEAVLLKPSEDVVELAVASDLQNVEWESNDGFTLHMKVMGSITPIVKSDEANQSGICHLTGLLS